MLVTQWDYYNEVYEAYEKAEVIDAEELLNATRNTNCRYIILANDRKINKNLTTLGLKLIKTVDKYNIYEDPEVAG
jgi:rRNA-processing protein FCF1